MWLYFRFALSYMTGENQKYGQRQTEFPIRNISLTPDTLVDLIEVADPAIQRTTRLSGCT
jgi:hypothetical protein